MIDSVETALANPGSEMTIQVRGSPYDTPPLGDWVIHPSDHMEMSAKNIPPAKPPSIPHKRDPQNLIALSIASTELIDDLQSLYEDQMSHISMADIQEGDEQVGQLMRQMRIHGLLNESEDDENSTPSINTVKGEGECSDAETNPAGAAIATRSGHMHSGQGKTIDNTVQPSPQTNLL